MSSSKDGAFTFEWSLENFSMCPFEYGEMIQSPSFVVEMLHASKWRLYLYPRGYGNWRPLICCLRREKTKNEYPEIINVDYSIAIVNGDTKMELNRQTAPFKVNGSQGKLFFKNSKNIFEEKYFYNDIFTIQCCMWRTDTPTSSLSIGTDIKDVIIPHLLPESEKIENVTICEEMLEVVISKWKDARKQQWPCELSVLTRIELERRSIPWYIDGFSTKQKGEKSFLVVASTDDVSPLLVLVLWVTEDDCLKIEIQRNSNKTQMCLKCVLTIISKQSDEVKCVEDQHLFPAGKEDVWQAPVQIKYSDIIKDKKLLLKDNILYLQCDFVISYKNGTSHTRGETRFPENASNFESPNQSETLSRVLENRKFCDVKLHVRGKTFPAHRAIICSSSAVFEAMFDSDMKEKNTGEVDIIDVEPETLDRLLRFIYTGAIQLKDIDLEDVHALYSAADKYQVLNLKMICSNFLKYNMGDKNVFAILSLAEVYQDNNLMKAAVEFISTHSRAIFKSQEWNYFVEDNLKLASKVMQQMLIKL